jgi:hypothetical protein
MPTSIENWFEAVYVINLRKRTDRLKAFRESLSRGGWPFRDPEVWEAVPGGDGTVPCAHNFTQGGGAFGCRQSHVGILQHCLMKGINSVLILEDDAFVKADFGEQVKKFLEIVPDDWTGIMLGGQHHQSPQRIADGVVKVNYAQRTHCYAARGDYMRGLYQRWVSATVHIDWTMEGWQSGYNVYAPERWLVGQARSQSDICGRKNAATMWNSVESNEYRPLFVLHVPRSVMLDLREHGLHTGHCLNGDDVDEGLAAAMRETGEGRSHALEGWLRTIQNECGQTDQMVAAAWHPGVTAKMFVSLGLGKVFTIQAETLEAALEQIPEEVLPVLSRNSQKRSPIVVLRASRPVAEELRKSGWHMGNWRDAISGVDNGLRVIYEGVLTASEKAEKIKEWCRCLREEADHSGGIVCAWHPAAKASDFEILGEPAIEITANNATEAVDLLSRSNS